MAAEKKNNLSMKMRLQMHDAMKDLRDDIVKKKLTKIQVADFLTKKIGVTVTPSNVYRMTAAMGDITFAHGSANGAKIKAADLLKRIEHLETRLAALEADLGKGA